MRWLIREIRIFVIGLAIFAFGTLVVAFGVYLGSAILQRGQNEEARTRYIEIQSMVHQETEELKQQMASIRNDVDTLIENQNGMSNAITELQQVKPSLEDRMDAVETGLASFVRQANLETLRRREEDLNQQIRELYIARNN